MFRSMRQTVSLMCYWMQYSSDPQRTKLYKCPATQTILLAGSNNSCSLVKWDLFTVWEILNINRRFCCFPLQMQSLHFSYATQSTMAMLCWCRTPSAVCWSEATRSQSSYCTHLAAGPKMMMCLWTGGWSSMLLSWRRVSWTQQTPLLPSSLHLWCMLDLQRWEAVFAYKDIYFSSTVYSFVFMQDLI